mgnify:FL=1
MKKSFLKISSLLFLFVLLISCDKDFNSLDSDVIGDDHFDLVYDEASLVAYSKATGVVQTNNLPLNALGIYKNDFFGTTKAHFVTQVELGSENPSFGFNPIIDSVYLYVPYFVDSDVTTETSGERIYELDSIYGNAETGKFRLKVLENGYYLRDLDPEDNLQSSQKYFNDDKATKIDPFKGSELLNNSSNVAQNDQFYFSKKELYIYKTNGAGLYVDSNGAVLSDQNNVTLRVIKERKTPGMWLDLKNSFFQQKILDAASTANLFSNNAFKNYFRGLLFEVEEINPDQGALAVLDFSKAELKILYKAASEAVSVENPTPPRPRRPFSLKMGYNASTTLRNNSINLLEYNNSTEYDAGLAGSNEVLGSDRLYVKGGNGSVAFIDLFTPTELETLRNNIATKNWLINDAKLTFYIDKSKMLNEDNEPERIYIYDATNNMVIADYTFDSSSGFNPKNNKLVFGGIIERETEDPKRGIKYTIRITEHIKRILKEDSNGDYQDNVKIGVSVTESINLVSSAKLKAPISANGVQISDIPLASILNPLGTVLFGNVVTDPDDEDKKLKLSIYFTKPNN